MLSTTIIIQCFNLGLGNVVKETRASEAQLLCSALTSSIQNELTYAKDVKVSGGKLTTYFSSARKMGPGCTIIVDGGEIKISNGTEKYALVDKANYSSANRSGAGGTGQFLTAYLSDITWDGKAFNVTLWVCDSKNLIADADTAEDGALAFSKFSVIPLSGVTTTP